MKKNVITLDNRPNEQRLIYILLEPSLILLNQQILEHLITLYI